MTAIKIKPQDITRHELIGLRCKVLHATDPSIIGFEGEVVDETRDMLILKGDVKEKKIPKKNVTFIFTLEGQKLSVRGNALIGRPEDRTKGHIPRN